jgi:hypothetical protein
MRLHLRKLKSELKSTSKRRKWRQEGNEIQDNGSKVSGDNAQSTCQEGSTTTVEKQAKNQGGSKMNEMQTKLMEIVESQSSTKMKNFVSKYGANKVSYHLQEMKKKGLINYNRETKMWTTTKLVPVETKQEVKKGFIQKVADKFRGQEVRDYGRAPDVPHYEVIENFDPHNPPADFIIVKFDHNCLDEALRGMTIKGAQQVGIPCKRVR